MMKTHCGIPVMNLFQFYEMLLKSYFSNFRVQNLIILYKKKQYSGMLIA